MGNTKVVGCFIVCQRICQEERDSVLFITLALKVYDNYCYALA